MPNQPAKNPRSVVVSTRVEPELLRELHRLAERRDVTLCAAAGHALALGLEQLQPAA
jgi:predicted transcriptional regulator